ncbi:mediator of RNA polymerase II transcription subunit 15a-like protein [Carex littledalei]|uniref:Mediator of RNA polymerase II transcription subunit 15a-like protein n=1 Tax=Carex littledalei TaxID=544730 RepID=A0A833QVJ5_9POAL|nr:mediator of RNA polymerase II transcription subunit 15a-like protein [Carex littledalei]
MDTLKRHLPVPVPEAINELQKIAVRFEEKIYSVATSQPDYHRKISLKMLSMENKTQPGLNPSLPNENRMEPGEGMTSQQPSLNPGQSLGRPQVMNQPPASRQQLPILQGSHNIPTAAPGGPSGATITPMSGPSISNSNPMSGPSGPTGSLPTDMYSNTQRRQLPQQHMLQNQMLYHQQQLKMLHKLQQQQQSLLQQNQMQMTSALAGGSKMMSAAPTGGMQQSQLNSIQQQPVGQGGSFQQQPLMRQQPQPTMQNPTMSMQLTNNVTDLQQQQLQMQPYQMQQRQLQPNQMQQNQMLNQQMMLGQQRNQLLESGDTSNMYNTQRQMQMQRQARLLQQQLPKQHLPSQLQSQKQQLPQQQQPSMMQQRGMQMPQQQQLPQQQRPSMMQQREMQMPQQQMQGSPALLQTQNNNAIDPQTQQQQQFIPQQQQRVLQDVASSPASIDSTAQAGHPGDWQEEIYQRLKYLKHSYFADLREIHQKLSINLSQLDSTVPPNARGGEQIDKLKHIKIGLVRLEHLMAVLQLSKHNMQIGLKDKLSLYEKQILGFHQIHNEARQQQPLTGVPSQQQPQAWAPSQQQLQAGAPCDQTHLPGLQQSQPSLQSQQQPQQMDSQNQLQQQLNTSAMPQSNNIGMPNAMQQGIRNTLQSDQLQASSTGLGSLQKGAMDSSMQNTMKTKKCKICEDCMHKRSNPN